MLEFVVDEEGGQLSVLNGFGGDEVQILNDPFWLFVVWVRVGGKEEEEERWKLYQAKRKGGSNHKMKPTLKSRKEITHCCWPFYMSHQHPLPFLTSSCPSNLTL